MCVSGSPISGGIFDPDKRTAELTPLLAQRDRPGFWDDQRGAQGVIDRINTLQQPLNEYDALARELDDAAVLRDLAEEEDDAATREEAIRALETVSRKLGDFEFRIMLGGVDDRKNAILTITPGAGGTESQDWAQMLLRMYIRWIERRGFEYEEMDLQPGQEAGIKSATLLVTGEYAYGYLKAEGGVHRLVRISPFDSASRRHTSFASVTVLPEVDEDIDIDINEKDLKIDVYRSSGAGGQHVNKTSSAVRITHIPTGIVVQCQNERSQHKNKAFAMKVLRSRLYQLKLEEEETRMAEYTKDQKKIEWGSQIRSYVFHPYTLVKDLRTDEETSNIQAVMDGDIDDFITSYLKQ